VVDNALKYSPPGGRVTVGVDLSEAPSGSAGRMVRIEVRDEGQGLQPGELDRFGDRFWRSRQHPNIPGSGLGISICKTLLERHGGRLGVLPGEPHGLTVQLWVPRADLDALPEDQGLIER
jgi:signal transduction histidine kinase